jgi:hypothetical protein
MHMRAISLAPAMFGIGAVCAAASAAAQDYPYDLARKNPKALKAWQAIAPSEYKREAWISGLNGTSPPMESVSFGGKPAIAGNVCKPHDCGGNFVVFVIARDGSVAVGALSSETLRVKRRYFGPVDPEARRLLDAELSKAGV